MMHGCAPEEAAGAWPGGYPEPRAPHRRPGWDEYFLGIARAVAARGECTRSQVGAVLVQARRIVSTGYNGVAAGERSCLDGACPRGRSGLPRSSEGGPGYASNPCIATHAEVNAINDAVDRGHAADINLGTIYLTKEPCERCAPVLRAWRLRVVWEDDTRGARGETSP
jgi:dCMP deaminase